MKKEEIGAITGRNASNVVTRSAIHFIGMVTGVVADGLVNQLEARMLLTWLTANPAVADIYPGNEIRIRLEQILVKGELNQGEETTLSLFLAQYATASFAESGSVTPESIPNAIDDNIDLLLHEAVVCFTGQFRFGTRKNYEEIALVRGAGHSETISKKVNLLVVGGTSIDWAHENFGRKIQKAVHLQQGGHSISIISEERWLELTK